jgi:hypothetical protein
MDSTAGAAATATTFRITAWLRGVLPPLLSDGEQASSTVRFMHSEASSVEELELREIPLEDQSYDRRKAQGYITWEPLLQLLITPADYEYYLLCVYNCITVCLYGIQ